MKESHLIKIRFMDKLKKNSVYLRFYKEVELKDFINIYSETLNEFNKKGK